MIDIHCHILPEFDDGSRNIEESIQMARIAEEDGIDTIIATPHYYRGFYERALEETGQAVIELNKELRLENVKLNVLCGMEVFLDKYTLEMYSKEKLMPLGDSKYFLVEFGLDEPCRNALDIIYEMKVAGGKVIIAHPERYRWLAEDLTLLNPFIEEGCLFQMNSTSLLGLHGTKVENLCKTLIKNNIISFIASDAHGTDRRKPQLTEAYDKCESLYGKSLKTILQTNAENLIKGQEIHQQMEKLKKKKFGIF